jgi:hypothetical protein
MWLRRKGKPHQDRISRESKDLRATGAINHCGSRAGRTRRILPTSGGSKKRVRWPPRETCFTRGRKHLFGLTARENWAVNARAHQSTLHQTAN